MRRMTDELVDARQFATERERKMKNSSSLRVCVCGFGISGVQPYTHVLNQGKSKLDPEVFG